MKPNCEFQKICSGKEKQVNRAEVTCYDPHCTAIQNGQPIRMCRDCHSKQHKDVSDSGHIYQGAYVCMYVCVYVCVCTYVCVRVCVYVYVCTYVCVHMYVAHTVIQRILQ